MELVVTITTLFVVILLQIIILANQRKNAALIRDFIANRAKAHQERERSHERRDNNFKQQHRNNQSGNSQKPPLSQPQAPAAGGVDNVEKSLRDINLKLKNAERDQEVARRKIQDGIGNREQRPPRQNRDRDNNRGGGNRDGQRRDRNGRGNWRGRTDGEQQFDNAPQNIEHPAAENLEEPRNAPEIMSTVTPTVLPDLNPVDFDADLQHGRKISVKRRALAEEGASVGQADQTAEEPKAFDASSSDSSTSSSSEPTSANDGEISFGRR